MLKITILSTTYDILSKLERVTIADSFVVPSNKIGGGNGEAKLYVGQNDESLVKFFGSRGFSANCFLLKTDLLRYLDDSRSEYLEPSQEYRKKDSLPELWKERREKVKKLDDIITFQLKDQIQIVGPRVYVNSDNDGYSLIRELSLPVISYINIYKLGNTKNSDVKYYFRLFVQDLEETSVEKEVGNDEVIIESPFNPNKIKVRTAPSTIGQIIDDLEGQVININTEFQRHNNLWVDKKKSRFIESLLLKLPIPPFYFNEKEENNLEVIDGLQRISTIKSFVLDKDLVLKDLEFLKEYDGDSFEDLPPLLKRRIKTFGITTYIIEKGTPDEVKYNIFKRVNTGGLVLTPQEIRHAINQGAPSDLVADLVRGEDIYDESNKIRKRKNFNGEVIELRATKEGKSFVKATDNRIGTFRMEDRDFATRFVSFYLISYKNYEPDLDTFLNSGMSEIKGLTTKDISELKENFYKAMSLAYAIFGNDAFRKRFDAADSRKPINKALFEVLSVTFAKMSDKDRSTLLSKKEDFKKKLVGLHNMEDGKFLRSITQGTAQKDLVEQRFKDIERIIKETL